MAERGGLTHRHYWETKGIKVSDGQFVRTGTILTRQGNKWKAGINVGGRATLFALHNGNVYFTRRRSRYYTNKIQTVINIKETKIKNLS